MAIEIVCFPIKNGDFPSFFVCLPQMYHIHHLGNHTSPAADPALNIVRTTLGMQHVAPQRPKAFDMVFEMCWLALCLKNMIFQAILVSSLS